MELTAEVIKSLLEKVPTMNADELATSMKGVLFACMELLAANDEQSRHETEMAIQYAEMKNANSTLQSEVDRYKAVIDNLRAQLHQRNTDLYGSSSESLEHLAGAMDGNEPSDPLAEEAPADGTPDTGSAGNVLPFHKKDRTDVVHGKKSSGNRKRMMDKLPTDKEYLIDPAALDEQYGKGNWRIRGWQCHRHVETIKTPFYAKETYTPILSVGLAHEMIRVRYDDFAPHSLASEKLVAYIMYCKYALGIPVYRLEHSLLDSGITLSRQVMVGWINSFTDELLSVAYHYLASILLAQPHHQCDETTKTIIKDGRGVGSKSYIWVHMTSELDDGPHIVIYSQELTRGTQHLRWFYAMCELEQLIITSDAYASYPLLEQESEGKVKNTGCMMHLRRRFFKAAQLLHTKGLSEAQLQELPEIKAISLIAEIYQTDEPLKKVSKEERLAVRQVAVTEKVDAFFDFVHSLDPDAPGYSDTMRDAIKYAVNQERYIRRFLDDPVVPIDNGACERMVKPLAMIRKNSLFSYSIGGAKCDVIIQSLVETAKLNGADPYYYLMYLLKNIPPHVRYEAASKADNSYLPDMTPWSAAYKQFEESAKMNEIGKLRFGTEVKPPKIAYGEGHKSYIKQDEDETSGIKNDSVLCS